MKKINLLLFVFASVLLFIFVGTSCHKLPNGGVPFYVQIDSPSFVSNAASEGTAHQKITDTWLDAGAENRGAFEMPVNVPILQSGNVFLATSAGVKLDGSPDNRKINPFMRVDTMTIFNATPGGRYHFKPTYRYFTDVKFWIDNFEGTPKFIGISNVQYGGIEGDYGGKINIGINDTFYEAYQTTPILIEPGGTREVYLEMEYKTDMYFTVGIRTATGSVIVDFKKIILAPNSNWNKIYLDLSEIIGNVYAASKTTTSQIYFQAFKSAGTPGNTYIDNVKIVHF